MEDRLQKIMSAHGAASRRDAEKLIREGKVTVNGEKAILGQKANPEIDRIEIDGKTLKTRAPRVYIMLNKPEGVVTTMRDERGRKTVRDLTSDAGAALYPVGRLDLDSGGLLLMTNDGELTNRLTHPSFGVEKVYRVWVSGGDIEGAAKTMSGKMLIDGYEIMPASVKIVEARGHTGIIEVGIKEGRNRQVRKMCRVAGLSVKRLVRISEGKLRLGDLEKGRWRYLRDDEIEYLESI